VVRSALTVKEQLANVRNLGTLVSVQQLAKSLKDLSKVIEIEGYIFSKINPHLFLSRSRLLAAPNRF
jgi:hypothetical protein